MFNPKQAIQLLEEMEALQAKAREVFGPLFNGGSTTMIESSQPLSAGAISGGMVRSRKHRSMSPAQRKRLSIATKQRWAKARKAGKTSLGGR
jgi:hypothetical protein